MQLIDEWIQNPGRKTADGIIPSFRARSWHLEVLLHLPLGAPYVTCPAELWPCNWHLGVFEREFSSAESCWMAIVVRRATEDESCEAPLHRGLALTSSLQPATRPETLNQ